jgi:hypothetical protein
MLRRYRLAMVGIPPHTPIPASYWGAPEAGLRRNVLYFRPDTPIHSILHEACHWVCMSPERRAHLDTDAGGDSAEEDAVCYLQILLGRQLPHVGQLRLCRDMDRWGYTFRLGSAAGWFHHDAADARAWLQHWGLIDADGAPTYRLRPAIKPATGEAR